MERNLTLDMTDKQRHEIALKNWKGNLEYTFRGKGREITVLAKRKVAALLLACEEATQRGWIDKRTGAVDMSWLEEVVFPNGFVSTSKTWADNPESV